MTNKPFTPNANEKIEAMTEAATAILTAIKALEAAQEHAEHWAEWETLKSFKGQLAEFMNCDSGEAGFEPYLAKISDDVFSKKNNPVRQAIELGKVYNRNGRAILVSVPED